MKRRDLYIFLIVVISIYSLANLYLYLKGYNAIGNILPGGLYFVIYLFLASLFVLGKIFERRSSSVVVDILNVSGGFWLAFMLYATLLLLVSDIFLLIVRISGIEMSISLAVYLYNAFIVATGSAVLIIIAGFINSVIPVRKRYRVAIDKAFRNGKGAKIFAVSDIHLGSIVRRRSLRVLSKMINQEKPDMLLILGDLVDGEINPVLRDDLLSALILPDGMPVYAIAGNHEYIGGIDRTIPYIESKGIRVLKDEVVEDEKSGVQIIGRRDSDSERFSSQRRRPLESLTDKANADFPVVVLDHQPLKKGAREAGSYDLILSGHTHNGQMWPFSYFVKMIFDHSYGLYKTNGSHHIVSSGFGTWGPRVRIGSRPEVLIIDLVNDSSKTAH